MTFMSEVSIRDLRNHGGEVVDRAARGESTVIRLGEIGDPSALPIEPLITAVTLAELSARPSISTNASEREARQAHSNRPKPISIRCHSTPRRHARSARSPRRFDGQAASRRLVRTTR
ncbi:MAG: hypothetical protein QOD37_1230 [Gaiellales bacterium]|nr:hypothetical protein [Gaiellales bacterium]